MSNGPWDVVGCEICANVWLIERTDRRSNDRAVCPSCGGYHQTDALRPLAQHDSKTGAAELRARLLSERAGHASDYADSKQYAEAEAVVESQIEAYIGDVDARDLTPLGSEIGSELAAEALGHDDDRFEAAAEAAFEEYDTAFEEHVDDAIVPEYQRDLFRASVDDALDAWRDIDITDVRTGELVLDNQFPADAVADVSLTDKTTIARSDSDVGLWADLLSQPGFQEVFANGARRFARAHESHELARQLEARDVASELHGIIERLGRGLDVGDGDNQIPPKKAEQLRRQLLFGRRDHDADASGLLPLARRLGMQRAAIDRIIGTASLTGWATPNDTSEITSTPTVTVRLQESFFDMRAEQRTSVLDLLWQLARHCEIVIVGDPLDLRRLSVEYDLDRTAFSERWTGRGTTTADEPAVRKATQRLDADSTGARILSYIREQPHARLSYAQLTSMLGVSNPTISNWVARRDDSLTALGLVDIIDADDSYYVELTPVGRETIDILNRNTSEQQSLQAALSAELHPSDHGRVTPHEHEGGEGDRPAGEPQAAGDPDPRRKGDGLAPVEEMRRSEAYGALSCGRSGEITLVDQPVARKDDYRRPAMWIEGGGGEVVVSAEYVNPMAYWASMARALTHERLFRFSLRERMEADDLAFAELFADHREELRASRCLGELADDLESTDEYIEALQDARDSLETMLSELHNDEFDDEARFRGAITREALGLVGTVIHVCDLCGVNVTRQLKLPTFSADFDADRWDDLCETVGVAAAIQSVYKDHTAYRQLYETREDKLQWTDALDVDAEDPTGNMLGSFVIAGDFGNTEGEKTQSFVEDLADTLENPRPLRENAPEFAIDISLRAFEFDREHFATAASRMLSQKRYRPTRDVVSVLRLFCGTPYDVTTAVDWLQTNEFVDEVRLDEIRYALSRLDTDRILPDCSKGARQIASALLAADGPVSTGELAKLADVSRSTITGRSGTTTAGERLAALGIATRTETGEWRLALPFSTDEERYETITPWVVADAEQLEVRDVAFEIASELVTDSDRWGDPDDPVCGCWLHSTADGLPDLAPLFAEWSWFKPWVDILEDVLDTTAVVSLSQPALQHVIKMGPPIEQAPLSEAPSSTEA